MPSARPTAPSPPATTERTENRRAANPASRPAVTAPMAAGSSARPASSGPRPWTSCRNWERKKTRPDRPRMVSRSARTAPEKPRWWKSRMSSRGAGRWSCLRTNQVSAPAPSTAATPGPRPSPCEAVSLMAYTMPIMPTRESPTLGMSHGPGAGFLDSGISLMPTTTSTAITGRLIRKTEPHQKCSSRNPPTTGPTAAPADAMAPQIPMARLRSRGSWKRLRIRARVDGIRVAPATPSSARATIIISGVVAYALSTETPPNATAPISSSFLRPMRSPREPIETRRPAMTKE
ncbi:hypothetical protein SCYAM73S_05022 [Streptomyces cyaneofuscatus]